MIDWHHPSYDNTICPDLCYPAGQAEMLKKKNIPRDHAAYQKYLHAQVRELMTSYAPIDIMWWDYSQGAMEGEKGWKAPELMEMARSLNPGVIMNNRLYAYSGLNQNRRAPWTCAAGTTSRRNASFRGTAIRAWTGKPA